jgi:steroid delta-isomerase-like uncharacterized protein
MMMSTNTELLQEWANLWSSDNVDAFLSLFTENCHYEDVALGLAIEGKMQLKDFFTTTRTAIPNLTMTVQSCFASEKNGAIEWLMIGTQEGAFHDIPATHKPIQIRGITWVELEDGKIKTNRDYWNLLSVLKQIGMFPES